MILADPVMVAQRPARIQQRLGDGGLDRFPLFDLTALPLRRQECVVQRGAVRVGVGHVTQHEAGGAVFPQGLLQRLLRLIVHRQKLRPSGGGLDRVDEDAVIEERVPQVGEFEPLMGPSLRRAGPQARGVRPGMPERQPTPGGHALLRAFATHEEARPFRESASADAPAVRGDSFGADPTSTTRAGETSRTPTTRSSMLPYRFEWEPDARIAIHPPTVENSHDCGKWPSVRPFSFKASSSGGPRIPASTVARPDSTSIARTRRRRRRSMTIVAANSEWTSRPPTTFVPPPNGITA